MGPKTSNYPINKPRQGTNKTFGTAESYVARAIWQVILTLASCLVKCGCKVAAHSSAGMCHKWGSVVVWVRPACARRSIPQLFRNLVVWAIDMLLHSLHSLEVVCDNPGTVGSRPAILPQIVKIWDCHWLQNLSPVYYSTEIAFKSWASCLKSYGDTTPHGDTVTAINANLNSIACS